MGCSLKRLAFMTMCMYLSCSVYDKTSSKDNKHAEINHNHKSSKSYWGYDAKCELDTATFLACYDSTSSKNKMEENRTRH